VEPGASVSAVARGFIPVSFMAGGGGSVSKRG